MEQKQAKISAVNIMDNRDNVIPNDSPVSLASTVSWPYSANSDSDLYYYYEKLEAQKKGEEWGYTTPDRPSVRVSIQEHISVQYNDDDHVDVPAELLAYPNEEDQLIAEAEEELRRLEEDRVAAEERELELQGREVTTSKKRKLSPIKNDNDFGCKQNKKTISVKKSANK